MKKPTARYSKGYTLLFAVIVASIVLSIGVTILTISRKEFTLTSSSRSSASALYAADSGLGCAEYWDSQSTDFASSTWNSSDALQCNGDGVNRAIAMTQTAVAGHQAAPGTSNTDFVFTFYTPFITDGTTNFSCAAVTVTKYYKADSTLGGTVRLFTDILSRGYNIGWNPTVTPGDCSVISPKKVERAIELSY